MSYNYNGRIDKVSPAPNVPLFKEKAEGSSIQFRTQAIQGIVAENAVSDVFFGQKNVDALQEAIRYQVYLRSNKKFIISRQSDVELQIIMRSIYLQYSKNLPFDLVGQIQALNQKVLDYAVPIVLTEVQQREMYRQDITRLPIPMERSQNVSLAGTKFLYTAEL
jgi:hypothetical protein